MKNIIDYSSIYKSVSKMGKSESQRIKETKELLEIINDCKLPSGEVDEIILFYALQVVDLTSHLKPEIGSKHFEFLEAWKDVINKYKESLKE
jgi:hypothetical protein